MRAGARIARAEQIAALRSAARVGRAIASGELSGLSDVELNVVLEQTIAELGGGVVVAELLRGTIADASGAEREELEKIIAALEKSR